MAFRWMGTSHGYATTTLRADGKKSKPVYMHRFITNAPPGMEIDHANGNGLDNRRENLRLVTHRQNITNRQGKTKLWGKYPRGVWRVSNRNLKRQFRVGARDSMKTIHGGYFATVEEAAKRAVELRRELGYIDADSEALRYDRRLRCWDCKSEKENGR